MNNSVACQSVATNHRLIFTHFVIADGCALSREQVSATAFLSDGYGNDLIRYGSAISSFSSEFHAKMTWNGDGVAIAVHSHVHLYCMAGECDPFDFYTQLDGRRKNRYAIKEAASESPRVHAQVFN